MLKDEIFTINEVAKYLKISKHTAYKLVERGKLPHFRVGRQLRYRKESIDQWATQQERANSREKG